MKRNLGPRGEAIMRAVKVLHMADMHLEWPFAGLGVDSHRGRMRREELKEVFASIVDLALKEEVQLFLIAGDLFEHTHLTRSTVRFLEQQFRRMAGIRVFISPGNHDPLLPNSYYRTYPWPENVHIFSNEAGRVDLDELGVSVYGWGFGAWEVTSWQLGGLRLADPKRLNIVLVHGGDERYHPFRPSDLTALGADYIALGHIHKPGVVWEEDGRLIAQYPGSPEALSFGEPGAHGVVVGTISRQANSLRFVVTGRREFITRAVDLTGLSTPEEVQQAVLAVDSEERRMTHAYRLQLTGAVDAGLVIDLPVLLERLAPHFHLLRLQDETQPDYDLAAVARERTARGLFVQRLLAMEAAASSEQEREQIKRALACGLAAFQEGGGER
ncbi:MAG: metallophosphoesterase family protein [Bacillota bacterium]